MGDGMELNGQELVAEAERIAREAHAGQVDKIGVDYIEHPRRVAARFDADTQSDEVATALLHDVIEDTSITADDLQKAGIPAHVIDAVLLLTKDPAETTLDE